MMMVSIKEHILKGSNNIIRFLPVPELTTRDVTVSEDVGEASVCVRLANTVEGPFRVHFDTSDGTAQGTCMSIYMKHYIST